MWARIVPGDRPISRPRAVESQDGAASPVSAGTKYTPWVSGTLRASVSVSAAEPRRPAPSRSHCTAAPVTGA